MLQTPSSIWKYFFKTDWNAKVAKLQLFNIRDAESCNFVAKHLVPHTFRQKGLAIFSPLIDAA